MMLIRFNGLPSLLLLHPYHIAVCLIASDNSTISRATLTISACPDSGAIAFWILVTSEWPESLSQPPSGIFRDGYPVDSPGRNGEGSGRKGTTSHRGLVSKADPHLFRYHFVRTLPLQQRFT